MRQQRKERIAMKVSVNSILVNLILSAFKLFAGHCGKIRSHDSDAAHSASDVFSTVIVMAGVVLASREADGKTSVRPRTDGMCGGGPAGSSTVHHRAFHRSGRTSEDFSRGIRENL